MTMQEISPAARPPEPLWRRFLHELPWLAAFLPLSVLFTWPLAAHLSTRLAGNEGDAWQNLWNLVWVKNSLWAGRSPFFTHELWHPHGTTLVFQTFDLPDLVWAAPLVGPLHPWTVHNLVVLGTFVFSGWSLYALARGLGASRAASFFAGCAFTFSTYHFTHDLGHLHILAMQWVPLYVLALWRMLERGGWGWAIAGGVLLALSSLASWYYLVASFFITVPILVTHVVEDPRRALRRTAPRALALCATFLVLILPLGLRMLEERSKEPIAGAHSPVTFSADLQSFVWPNAAQWLSTFTKQYRRWSGNSGENGTYIGYVLIALVVAGLFLRAPRVRVWLAVALVGIVLSLGPRLHIGGTIVSGDVMPYAWLQRIFPLLEFMGVPVRLAFTATLGLAAALAPSLDALAGRFGWRLAAPFAVLAIAEHAPRAFVTSAYATPAFIAAWADDPSDFAVLEATRDSRHLWHQIVHGHPIVGGYVSRVAERLEEDLRADPTAGALWDWDPPERSVPVSFERIDFGDGDPIVRGAEGARFSVQVRGTLVVREAGDHRFVLRSDDGSELRVDGRVVVDNGGVHPAREREGTVHLEPGEHRLALSFRQEGGGYEWRAWLEGPDHVRRILGPDDVPAGFQGTARARRRELRGTPEEALARLRERHIRYIVQGSDDSRWAVEDQLGLSPVYEGEGLRVYEVPGAAGP